MDFPVKLISWRGIYCVMKFGLYWLGGFLAFQTPMSGLIFRSGWKEEQIPG